MNRADVEMLNQAIGNLGNSFMQNRQMAAAARERELDRQMRQALLGEQIASRQQIASDQAAARTQQIASRQQIASDQAAARTQQYEAYREHWKKMEDVAGLHAATQEILDAGKRIQESMARLGEQVRGGSLTQDDANQYFKSAIDAMPEAMKQKMMTDPALGAAYAGRLNWSQVGVVPPKDIVPQPFNVTDQDGKVWTGVRNPNSGSFQFTPRPAAPPTDTVTETIPVPGGAFGATRKITRKVPSGSANAPAAAAPTVRFVRDPKTGKMVLAPAASAPLPQAAPAPAEDEDE